jgi:predicted nuclease of predicted toxin-antitoxin system
MQLLADESCDFSVVRKLRAAGHDVTSVSEIAPGATDDAVIEFALREKRVLITEDKDFGQLVFAAAKSNSGVIFVRFPAAARAFLPDAVLSLVNSEQDRLFGAFVVVQPSRIRITRAP